MSAILVAVGAADAQDTIRYPDSCYMYNPFEIDSVWGCWVDQFQVTGSIACGLVPGPTQPDSDYLARNGYELVQDPWSGARFWLQSGNFCSSSKYTEYVAPGQTWIYGIAATTGGSVYTNCGRYLDSIYTLGELYNVSYITDSNFNLYAYIFGVLNGEAYCIDSVRWIRHNNPYRFFEYKYYPPINNPELWDDDYPPSIVTYSYEFYFDKPVSVADTFFIGVRFPFFNGFAFQYAWWFDTKMLSGNALGEYENTFKDARSLYLCEHYSRTPLCHWGGFFPILTPRDTTRCDPVREVQAIWATDTSVTLQWHGGNATQWEVEYAEADGVTVYTVTTTTPRVTLTGLRPTTNYLAHVRAWCTRDSEYGEWSPFVEARTTVHQPDDTTQGPDTVKIDAVGLFTRLMSNPASGVVTVQSAYSLGHVAVYDVQGHLVLEQKAAGNAATFDVGALPKGVYMVTVRTVAGTTTTRLLVE